MAIKIRLKRIGTKKNPFYHVMVADSRAPRDGRLIEGLGYYNPLTENKTVKVDTEETQKWTKNGVKPTAIVDCLFKVNNAYEQEAKAEVEVEENEET